MKRLLDVNIAKLLLFLLMIPLVSGNIENAIICIEGNGHIAIESPMNGTCGIEGLSGYANEHCSGCTDIPISFSAEINRSNSSAKTNSSVAIATNIHYLADAPRLSLGNHENLPGSRFFSHAFLSSVIIRI